MEKFFKKIGKNIKKTIDEGIEKFENMKNKKSEVDQN